MCAAYPSGVQVAESARGLRRSAPGWALAPTRLVGLVGGGANGLRRRGRVGLL